MPVQISCNNSNLITVLQTCRVFCHNSHMIGSSVPLKIQEYQIPGPGCPGIRSSIKPIRLITRHPTRKHLKPRPAIIRPRHDPCRNIGIIQTERNKHGAPVFIQATVPCSVTGIPSGRSVFCNNIILRTLSIIDLALCHSQQVIRPDTRPLHTGQSAFPVCSCLQISFGI